MDYRLDGLSPRTFEHLVQSLAHTAITNEVTPFGDGPDGGREATFDGPTAYGSEAQPWQGYGVIQAKFRQRPGQDDAAWAEIELKKELQAFSERKRKRQTPEYFIFATNVVLSPTLNTGGKDRILRLLREFASENNLKGFDIWDYDKIRILLNNNSSVRTSFAAWITPGDVLLELAKHLRAHRPDYYKIVINYLQKELLSDQSAKLEQAGHSADEAIPLSQVFVDLPVSTEPVRNMERAERGGSATTKFTAGIIKASRSRFIHTDNDAQISHNTKKPVDSAGRFVLIGGPGQGKTTLGQFICQIFRTALLEDVNPHLLDAPVKTAMDGVIKQWINGQLPRPDARRLPFRVVLSEFAKMLADGEVTSLLAYLTEHISKRAGRDLDSSQVKELLLAYPSVLILDGLDEVPASTNREQLLDCVRDFRIDVVTEQIDVLIVATSRPQGYNDDFSPMLYQHLYLEPLPPNIAMDYARRLTQIRFGQDPVRSDKVISRLERALKASATARLMKSPLQVTIMTLLVDRMGQPPQERWTLFSEYYNLIYQREIERDIPAASILRDYRTDIDAIHRRVGLVLQIESEQSGGTDAKLSTAQFSGIVEQYLIDEGHEGSQLREISASVIEAATNRLVFLVGLESGVVGFEIRSLQEFMAAEGLMDAEDGVAQARLRSIAAISNWRNVFLFAAGKAFSDRRHLRDTVGQICQELNDEPDDELSMRLHAGSRLALDLLDDGPAARQPAMSRTLTRLSLRLLDTDDNDLLNRLASVYQERTAPIYAEVLASRLSGPQVDAMRAAMAIARIADVAGTNLSGLVDRAKPLLNRTDRKSVQKLVTVGDGRPGLIRDSIVEALPHLKPETAIHLLDSRRGYRRIVWRPADTMPPLVAAVTQFSSFQDELRRLSVRIKAEDGFAVGEVSLISVEQPEKILKSNFSIPAASPEWAYLDSVLDFIKHPSRDTLAAAIATAANADPDQTEPSYFSIAPWVLARAVFDAKASGDWEGSVRAAKSGEFGDVSDWRDSEELLIEGFSLASLNEHAALVSIAKVSFSFDQSRASEVVSIITRQRGLVERNSIAHALYSYLTERRWSENRKLEGAPWIDDALRALLAGPDPFFGVFAFESCQAHDPHSEAWEPHIRRIPPNQGLFLTNNSGSGLEQILQISWKREPSTHLYPGFCLCLLDPVLGEDCFPQPEPPLTRKHYGDYLYCALLLDLRKNGDVHRIAAALPELDDDVEIDHRLVAALQRRHDDAEFERQLLLLHGMVSQIGMPNLMAGVISSLEAVASARMSGLMDEGTWHRLALPSGLRLAILQKTSTEN